MTGTYRENDVDKVVTSVATHDGFRPLGQVIPGTATLTAPSTTLYTPTTGNRLRLRWVGFGMASDGTECVVTVKLGATNAYVWPLSAPGAFARTSAREADVDAALVVTLSTGSGPVYFNYELEELTP